MSEVVKQTADYKIEKKRNGRYSVKGKDGKWINGEKKIEILNSEGLIKVAVKKAAPPEEAPAKETAEAPAEANTEETETPAE